jgi:hypothetical protein
VEDVIHHGVVHYLIIFKNIKRATKMREIEFKGRTKNGTIVYGYYCEEDGIHKILVKDGKNLWFEVDPESVCQYIGMRDKNGIKIYDRDNLAGVSANEFSLGNVVTYKVMWGVDSWHIKDTYFSIQELFNFCNGNVSVLN